MSMQALLGMAQHVKHMFIRTFRPCNVVLSLQKADQAKDDWPPSKLWDVLKLYATVGAQVGSGTHPICAWLSAQALHL